MAGYNQDNTSSMSHSFKLYILLFEPFSLAGNNVKKRLCSIGGACKNINTIDIFTCINTT